MIPVTEFHNFGIRSVPPCGDCYDDGHCSMNCGPKDCTECNGLTYVIREFGEIACPECQPDAYEEQLRDTWLGY